MAKVLVTGGCGLIGDHVCSGFLKKGYEVVAIDGQSSDYNTNKENFTYVEGKSTDKAAYAHVFDKHQFDTVIHLACTVDNDLDGSMTNYNGWSYTYNGENRLIVAENAAAGVRVEADYDYMGRRLFKKVYNNNTLTKHSVFVYDEFKQIAEFDVLNNNSLKASYLWQPIGLDVVLLRNAEYLIADGNKNIIQVRNAAGSVTDSYVYDPFGKVTHNGNSENSFQFSSEFFDSETELVYYNYRYYMPLLGRWILEILFRK